MKVSDFKTFQSLSVLLIRPGVGFVLDSVGAQSSGEQENKIKEEDSSEGKTWSSHQKSHQMHRHVMFYTEVHPLTAASRTLPHLKLHTVKMRNHLIIMEDLSLKQEQTGNTE